MASLLRLMELIKKFQAIKAYQKVWDQLKPEHRAQINRALLKSSGFLPNRQSVTRAFQNNDRKVIDIFTKKALTKVN